MFKQVFSVLLIFTMFFSGNSYAAPSEKVYPDWLVQKSGGKRKISELTADGKTYYMIVSPCCDQFSPVFDEEGNQVCSLGGFTGRGDGKCPPFDVEK